MTDDDDPLAALARIRAEAALRRIAADVQREHGGLLGGVDLFRPMQPPPGVDDPRPVHAASLAAAVAAHRSLAALINARADAIERDPWSDTMADVWVPAIGTAADLAVARLALFRETRDCRGDG